MTKTIRARFTGGVFKPLEEIEFPEGKDAMIIFEEKPEDWSLIFKELVKQVEAVSTGGNSVEDIRKERQR